MGCCYSRNKNKTDVIDNPLETQISALSYNSLDNPRPQANSENYIIK